MFEEIKLNQTYRLSQNVCKFVNKICVKLDVEFKEHVSKKTEVGEVKIIEFKDLFEIINYIENNNEFMILFKEKNDATKELGIFLIQNNIFINSPYITLHPIIKDFQYLIKYLLHDCDFSLHILFNAFGKDNIDSETIKKEKEYLILQDLKQYVYDAELLFYNWMKIESLQEFLKHKLQKNYDLYINILNNYAQFYKHKTYRAIEDEDDFYNNKKYIFNKGVYLNTIHSAKGKEADNVYLINTQTCSKYNTDTDRLLYVAITRAKKNLYLIKTKPENEKNSWMERICNILEIER